MTEEQKAAVYAGAIDFIDGRWFEKLSQAPPQSRRILPDGTRVRIYASNRTSSFPNRRHNAVGVIGGHYAIEGQFYYDVRHTKTDDPRSPVISVRYAECELKVLDGGTIRGPNDPCLGCRGTGQSTHFQCPECGGNKYGSSAEPLNDDGPVDIQDSATYYMLRNCHDCKFRWPENDDETYFLADSPASSCDSCDGSGKNISLISTAVPMTGVCIRCHHAMFGPEPVDGLCSACVWGEVVELRAYILGVANEKMSHGSEALSRVRSKAKLYVKRWDAERKRLGEQENP